MLRETQVEANCGTSTRVRAQRRLDEAELRRAPSTRLEAELDALHRERGKLLSDQASAERAAREAEAEAIEQAAAAETADIVGRVTAVLPAITIPTPEVDDGPIRAAARHHARAKAGFDKATAILAERQKHADDLAGLIAEHQHTLDQIGDRLMAGTELPSDNVQRLRSFQFVERKKPLHQAAMGEVRAAEDSARSDGYNTRLEALDEAMLEVLGQAAAANRRIPRQPAFIGSHQLRTELRRLATQYPNLARDLDPADPRRWAAQQRAAVARQLAGAEG
jgi:hypothetical protein